MDACCKLVTQLRLRPALITSCIGQHCTHIWTRSTLSATAGSTNLRSLARITQRHLSVDNPSISVWSATLCTESCLHYSCMQFSNYLAWFQRCFENRRCTHKACLSARLSAINQGPLPKVLELATLLGSYCDRGVQLTLPPLVSKPQQNRGILRLPHDLYRPYRPT